MNDQNKTQITASLLLSSEPPDARVCPVCGGEKNPHLRACEPCIQQPAMTARAHMPNGLPWHIIRGAIYRADAKHEPFTANDGTRHDDYHTGLIALVYEGQTEFVLRACNTHAALLDALKQALDWIDQQLEGSDAEGPRPQIRAAIRAAEGEEGL